MGYTYTEAVAYWTREGSPDRMDADHNAIPCETVYPHSEVVAFWGDPLPTTTTPTDVFYSIVTHGLHPDVLAGSGGWFGSGCSPGSSTLPDGVWWGYITDVSPSSIMFDLACLGFTVGEHPEEGGWVIENNSHRLRVVPTAAVAQVTCLWWQCPPSPFPYAEWLRYGPLPPADPLPDEGIWIYVNDGAITEIGIEVLAG
jgi:hypothetical protein